MGCKHGTIENLSCAELSDTLWPTPMACFSEDIGAIRDRYEHTLGGQYDRNDYRKYRVVPRMHPLRARVYASLVGLEAEGVVDFQGRRGITSIVCRNLRPVIFGVGASVWARFR